MIDAARFAAVAGALWAAHDLADHVVQTDHQAAGKATSWRAMAGHVGGYGATQAVALAGLHAGGVRLAPGRAVAGLTLSLGSHAFLDRRWPVVSLLERTGSDRFARPLVRVLVPVDGNGRTLLGSGVPRDAEVSGALPLHGPYLADQALHHVFVVAAALVITWVRRRR